MSPHDGKIFPVEFTAGHHGGQDIAAYQMLGNNRKTGGVSVQTVAAAENKRLALFFIIPGKSICQ